MSDEKIKSADEGMHLALKLFSASVNMTFDASDRVIANEKAEAERQRQRAIQAEDDLYFVVAAQRMLSDPRYARRLVMMLMADEAKDESDDHDEYEREFERHT